MITYVPKEKLFPAFGMCYGDGRIEIREDLPVIVRPFIEAHETYHSTDRATFWLWREMKANIYAGIRHPIGLVATAAMSLSPDRLKYYFSRFKDKK